MIFKSKDNPNSHLTIKDRKYPSFPTKYLFRNKKITGKVLDFGCGTGVDVQYLKSKKIEITGYDPHYFPHFPESTYDTIICNYVLNILLPEEQSHVLMAVSELLNVKGKAYFSVRRDIKKNGFRYNPKRDAKTYQCNVLLPYKSVFKNEHCEIYEYQHINQANSIKKQCPFCSPEPERKLITESATAYCIEDKFPVSKGHVLVIPKNHESNYFNLSQKQQLACWMMVNRVKEIIKQKYNPDGINIGMNVGSAAGQTIPHVHIHLIPRYKGDMQSPRGGVRGVIPSKQNY